MIFVNYKNYEEGTGENAVSLTKILESVAHETQIKIIPSVQNVDTESILASTSLEVWLQKPEEILPSGISGMFLNHSMYKVENFDDLYAAHEKAIAANLKTLIFAADLDELKKIAALSPTYIAYEPPSLIGSTTTSVAQAEPEIISQAVEIARSFGLPLVVGAGIHSQEDVRKSLELGAVGVAVATDIVKAEDPRKELLDLVEGFK
ncbi:MAG TPA: triose-phosphate isomerase [Alphaproteobacteria bacterium]|jgi:triosephosphate isomerase|nr:triose-phosphate isomerase [Alphaproteobacteria bacterium]